MRLGNLVRPNCYANDLDRFLAEPGEVLAQRLAGVEYATTCPEVTRLAMPDLLVELEATTAE